MKISLNTILCLLALLALTACSSMESRSQKLQLGMTKDTAVKLLGSDYTIVAARLEADGSPVSVLKFTEKKQQDLYLYFRSDKLTQWGDITLLQSIPPAAPTGR